MLGSAAFCVIAAFVAAVMGWSGVAVGAACLAQVFFGIFLVVGLSEPFPRPVGKCHVRLSR